MLLGIIGGIGLIVGPTGLFVLQRRRDPALMDVPRARPQQRLHAHADADEPDRLLLLIFRDTSGMGMLLAVHLGVVLGLFISLPYGKFVHALYRFAALAKYAAERKRAVFVE